MLILPIMVVIGIVNHNNLWLYIALALAVLGSAITAGKQVQAQKAQKEALESQLLNFFKGVQAKNN